jgi:pimeloyl-ACP methyl ester carboxylesterase
MAEAVLDTRRVFASTAEDSQAVGALLASAAADAPPFWESGELIRVRVGDAEVRVIHCGAAEPALRPIVLVPGFGVIPEGFQDFYASVHGQAELYYVETREKASSRLDRHADMSVARMARDLAEVLAALGLGPGRDFVLAAVCWGATIVLEGMRTGVVRAPTVLACDPMHALWFPRWLLRWVSPLLPVSAVTALRPLVFKAMLGDMKEPVQKRRARAFVYGADVGKWKRAAEAARDLELMGTLDGVQDEVFVLNGTADKVHDPSAYPLVAREMPRGRFLYMGTGEENREKLFGAAAREFARVRSCDGLPPVLARFEKQVCEIDFC